MQFCLPPGTITWENGGLIYGTKEVHQPLRNQKRKKIAHLFFPVAIGNYIS